MQDFEEIRALMKSEGLSDSAIGAFQQAYEQLVRGDDGMISEASITPASDVPVMSDIKDAEMSADKIEEVRLCFDAGNNICTRRASICRTFGWKFTCRR